MEGCALIDRGRYLVLLDIIAWFIHIVFLERIATYLELEVTVVQVMQLFDHHLIHPSTRGYGGRMNVGKGRSDDLNPPRCGGGGGGVSSVS